MNLKDKVKKLIGGIDNLEDTKDYVLLSDAQQAIKEESIEFLKELKDAGYIQISIMHTPEKLYELYQNA